jgi:hypothetical protein
MSNEMKEILDKLKHIKSENFTQEAEEAILKEFEKKIKNDAGRRLKAAFVAGFLASNDKFNAQTPYSMQEDWFNSEEFDIERKLESTISQLSIDLDEDYNKFLQNESWYNKKLVNSDVAEVVRRKKLSY